MFISISKPKFVLLWHRWLIYVWIIQYFSRNIYNPIDYDFIDKSVDSGQDPFNHNYINIVASGRIIDQKAYDVLIKAFKIVIEKNPNFRLYILGDDVIGLKQELLELVEKL